MKHVKKHEGYDITLDSLNRFIVDGPGILMSLPFPDQSAAEKFIDLWRTAKPIELEPPKRAIIGELLVRQIGDKFYAGDGRRFTKVDGGYKCDNILPHGDLFTEVPNRPDELNRASDSQPGENDSEAAQA